MKSINHASAIFTASVLSSILATTAFAETDDAGVREVQMMQVVRQIEISATAPPTVSAAPTPGRATKALAAPSDSGGLQALVRRHAEANGVPFAIADAIVRVESRYNPRASNRGNYGLMQIRLQTARGIGYGGDASGLLNADTNARYGMKYLAMAYRMAGGDTCRTIMKYQSGHMATSLSGANRAYCSKVRTITARG